MLDIADIVTAYGKIEALKGVSLHVESGKITCLLGPNGAGKTTLDDDDCRHSAAAPRLDPARRDGACGLVAGSHRVARCGARAGEPAGISADERA